MTDPKNIFDELQLTQDTAGRVAVVERLIDFLESERRFHELFEALKMKSRLELGLPAVASRRDEPMSTELEFKIEQGLIEACRRVGMGFLKDGKIREGWMYMRPVGDRKAVAAALANLEADDENADALIEVLLHEGVDVYRGYQIALDRLGTCNSITLFESALHNKSRDEQKVAAELLVRHVYRELYGNLRRDIAQREGKEPTENTIELLLKPRPDLLRDGSYHLDTSHLASTVRFARVLDNPEALKLALDLAIYGRHLHPQYQYPGEEPFLDLFPSSICFFRALLGQQVDVGIRYFTQKAESVDQNDYGTIAIEILIDLLARCGRPAEALKVYHSRLTSESRLVGLAPTMLELSMAVGEYQSMQEICKQRGDLLGFAAALVSR